MVSNKNNATDDKKRDRRETSLAINTAIIFISKAASQMVGVFLLPLYTFSLAPAEYGLADLLLTYILLLIPFCSVQLEMATFRYLIDVRGDKKEEKHVIKASWSLLLMLIGLAFIVAAVAIVIFDIPYGWYAFSAVGVGMTLSFFQQIARGMGRVTDFAVSGIIAVIGTVLISALLLILLRLRVEGVILGVIVANLSSIGYLFVRLGLWRQLGIAGDGSLQRRMLRYALPLVPSTVSWWAIGAFGRTVITIVLGVASAGLYAVAYRFTMLFSGIPYVFNLSWTESASLSVRHSDRDAYYSRIANGSLKLFCIVAAIMLLLMGLVFDLLINSAYRQAYWIIPILMLGLLMNAMVSYYHAIFAACKDTKVIAISSIIAALVSIAVSVVLIGKLGIYGVALGATSGYAVMLGWCYVKAKQYVDVRYMPGGTIVSMALFIAASIVYYGNNWIIILIGAVTAITCSLLAYRQVIYGGARIVMKRINKGKTNP